MSIINTTLNTENTTSTLTKDRLSAKIWLNIGITIGEGDDKQFITLPIGLPVDTMQPANTKTSNVEFKKLQTLKNTLLQKLITAGNKIKPGESVDITNQLQIKLFHVNEDTVVDINENSIPDFDI